MLPLVQVINIKTIMRYFTFFFYTKSSQSGVYFML